MSASSSILIYVNGKKRVEKDVDPRTTVLQYVRNSLGLTGSKLGCGEGGCGACTVMISKYDPVGDEGAGCIQHFAANACLTPLCSVDGCAVTTIEGIGGMKQGLHPIQKRIAELHGSQCGFCTPGIVMSIYATMRSNPSATPNQIEDALDGNLCRCTGYRPIIDAARSLSNNKGDKYDVDEGCPFVARKDVDDNHAEHQEKQCPFGGAVAAAKKGASCPMSGISAQADPSLVKKEAPKSGCCGGNKAAGGCPCLQGSGAVHKTSEDTISTHVSARDEMLARGLCEPIFPPELMTYQRKFVKLVAAAGEYATACAWYQPTSVAELVAVKEEHPGARLVVGNTEVGIETKFKGLEYDVLVNPSYVAELQEIKIVKDSETTVADELTQGRGGMHIGASVSINKIRSFVSDMTELWPPLVPAQFTRGFVACKHMADWFASNQIRNVACIGGNIATASPISDMNPMLLACGARLKLTSTKGSRVVPISDFFLAYRKVDLQPTEIIETVFVPFVEEYEFVLPFKQARRREDDISIVTSGIRIKLEPKEIVATATTTATTSSTDASAVSPPPAPTLQWVITDAALAYGGMAPLSKLAKNTAASLVGKRWCFESIESAFPILRAEFDLPKGVPGGQAEYRMALAVSFLFKTYLTITTELSQYLKERKGGSAGMPALPVVEANQTSGTNNFIRAHKPETRGEQTYTPRVGGLTVADEKTGDIPRKEPIAPDGFGLGSKNRSDLDVTDSATTASREADPEAKVAHRGAVGESLMHSNAYQQVSGETKYTWDTPLPPRAAHASLVMSTRAHARLVKVDTTAAELCPGFIAYYCAKDVVGNNRIGAIVKDEEVFAVDEVTHVGAVIGVIICESHEQALYAAKKVAVQYEDLPVVVSIEEAIANKSFFEPDPYVLATGDVDSCKLEGDIIHVTGTGRVGAQEHFYLETNCSLAIPHENDQLEIISSTQNVMKTQNFCASVCGLPANKVVAKCKRMGGGFGGKETRSVFIACTAALAAKLLDRPVMINIERDVDMSITGQRHSFYYEYSAGCTKDGKLKYMDAKLYSNGGFSMDLSNPVLHRALFHSDNSYYFPNMRVSGWVCKTNQPSHTAYRGFGGPQGLLMCEYVMSHLAKACNMDLHFFRTQNLYVEGNRTHFGTVLEQYYVPRMWKQLHDTASYFKRAQEIEQFNAANRWIKRGISMVPTKFGISFTAQFMNQGGALVHVYTDGTVLVAHGGTEMGQGLNTKVIQVASQSFGIPPEQVFISETASSTVANSSPTAASMSTDLYGMAVLDACSQILKRLAPLREKMQREAASTGAEVSWQSLITTAYYAERINLSAQGFFIVPTDSCGYDWSKTVEENNKIGRPFNYFTQGVACTEVEVDCLTGDHRILRADIMMDVGKSINPAIDIGQIEGAFTQGYGWSTMEEMIWGDSQHPWVRPGNLFTKGPGFYKIPAFNDVPVDFRIHLSDTENRLAVHSSKAVGEPPFFMGCSAFLAIQRAIEAARAHMPASGAADHHFHVDHPASSERIRMACADDITKLCIAPASAPTAAVGQQDETKANTAAAQYRPLGSW